ncbi:putative glycoside hydrolase family 5 protein [Diaporthe ampelina]|uniref:Putative glycoside hydrolase family 5 protein n=1 Tax=Diaporthe ampelina TaxID=1214573 RepID=A0A0G2FZQ6_9PEZI|nr:putative glycoside hydrolase family 5 protein [Diaporthe ampelina]
MSRRVLKQLIAAAICVASAAQSWPNGPFVTEGSSILDASGNRVTYAGVNWPGAAETMVPEGLQYQSIETIVSKIKSVGMNSIRLTYATELIDQIYMNNGADISIQQSFVNALGQDNGTDIFNKVIAKNPSFSSNTTRLQVYDAIAAECARQNIYVHLDNHVSMASWCCTPFDGNAWWGDTFFSPTNWTRGLVYMAEHGKNWSNLMSMSLYNELRPPFSMPQPPTVENYTWEVWYDQVRNGSKAINSANPDVLIFLSGINGGVDLSTVVNGEPFEPSNQTFNRSDFAGYENKLVLELHSYNIIFKVDNCPLYNENLFDAGYSAVRDNATNRFPVMMTEFGFTNDATTWQNDTYARCAQAFLKDQVPGQGWMIWVISGSYYVRQGKQDYDESWGLLNHDWSDWRSPEFIDGGLKPLVSNTLLQDS